MTPAVPITLKRTLRALTQRREDDSINTSAWEHAFGQTLSQYHLAAYSHGSGIPVQKLLPEDLNLVQTVVNKQLKYLKGYSKAWNEGRYKDRPEVALHRTNMYADATLGTWWMGHTRGWPLPAYPGDGTTQCKTNCRCSWDVVELPGEGNANAIWLLGPADHCQTCMQRSEDWAPLQIRGGELQL